MNIVMENGKQYIWKPGLQMDPDTGSLVELVRPIATGGGVEKWKALALPSGRMIDVYASELVEAS